ncbi:hypothetical protein BK816_05535 [Boudabousia tangfeifanii]|uniref:Cell division initiation protein n=1 Tax=Boudabousia tangfeifanii TaxID=1912795 RepID=A0A1D9MKL7_9ACTO|nr:hypothetical protein [Boudabousia tangfeifanii]AOZ72822.1 hypothetical protein BK816_05535 [Boudabousia tangfeifanii]
MSEHMDDATENLVLDEATAISLLDHLKAVVTEASSLPLVAKSVVNKEQVLELLEQIREALPREMVTANTLITDANATLERAEAESQEILKDAQLQAEETLQQAEAQANQLKTDTQAQTEEQLSQAQAEVENKLADANRQAEQILADAKAQAERLVSAEEVLRVATERAHEVVRRAEHQADVLTVQANEYARAEMESLVNAAQKVAAAASAGMATIDDRLEQYDEQGAYDEGEAEDYENVADYSDDDVSPFGSRAF